MTVYLVYKYSFQSGQNMMVTVCESRKCAEQVVKMLREQDKKDPRMMPIYLIPLYPLKSCRNCEIGWL